MTRSTALSSVEIQSTWRADDDLVAVGSAEPMSFEQRLRDELAVTRAAGLPFSLVLLQPTGRCDCFADILAGVALADTLVAASAYSLGGGTFALLLPGVERERASWLVHILDCRLRFAAEEPATLAAGVAAADDETRAPELLFAAAHLALLQSTRWRGGDSVVFGDEALEPGRGARALDSLLEHLAEPAEREPARDRVRRLIGVELADRLLEM